MNIPNLKPRSYFLANVLFHYRKLRVREPPGSLYIDIQRVRPMANLFRQLHTMASGRAFPVVVNVNLPCPFINHRHGLNPHLLRVYVYCSLIGEIKHALKSSACAG